MMKKIILFLMLICSLQSFSQVTEIKGKQIIQNGSLQYFGEDVYIASPSKIIKIIGDTTSFSLQKGNKGIYKFFYKNGKYVPNYRNITIEPGNYHLYPDLPATKDSVQIEIKLRIIKQ